MKSDKVCAGGYCIKDLFSRELTDKDPDCAFGGVFRRRVVVAAA